MGRATEALAYLNSSTEDWQKGRISNQRLSSFTITEESKLVRRWYRYGENKSFADYLKMVEKNEGIKVSNYCFDSLISAKND